MIDRMSDESGRVERVGVVRITNLTLHVQHRAPMCQESVQYVLRIRENGTLVIAAVCDGCGPATITGTDG